jgi:hypothetical protein
MKPHSLTTKYGTTVHGYKPDLYVSSASHLVEVHVPGIVERVSLLPSDLADAVLTPQGHIVYRRTCGAVETAECDQKEKVREIVLKHDAARIKDIRLHVTTTGQQWDVVFPRQTTTARIDEMMADEKVRQATTELEKRHAAEIATLHQQHSSMLATFRTTIAALQSELSTIAAGLAALKAERTQRPCQRPDDAIDEWTPVRPLLPDQIAAMDDNPFVRGRR